MRTEICPDAPVPDELKRALLSLSQTALTALSSRGSGPDEAVHRARKAIRSARAVLRLARKHSAKREWAARNGLLRRAAQLLSQHRDARVRLATVGRLAERARSPAGSARMLRARVAERVDIRTGSLEQAADKAEQLLQRFRGSIEQWPGRPQLGAEAVGKELRRALKKVRRRFEQADKAPSMQRLHALRKRGKDAREQLRLLRPLDPDRLGKLERKLDALCDDVGEARDLDLTGEMFADMEKNWPGGASLIGMLREQAAARHDKLVRRGLKRARAASAKSPKSVERLIARRWTPRIGGATAAPRRKPGGRRDEQAI